jgi:hypothetical protein
MPSTEPTSLNTMYVFDMSYHSVQCSLPMWCHSVIQNPTAKYISKKLKPLVEVAPTILKGTKDLAIRLSKINLDSNHQWYLVSSNIVVFYPNVPLEQCLYITTSLYEEYMGALTTHEELLELEVFLMCLQTGNKDLIT